MPWPDPEFALVATAAALDLTMLVADWTGLDAGVDAADDGAAAEDAAEDAALLEDADDAAAELPAAEDEAEPLELLLAVLDDAGAA